MGRSRTQVQDGFDRTRWLFAFFFYLLFVVYGSLVPLEWREVPFDVALARFANIAFLQLGAASRADWVANVVLYVPLALLACVSLLGLRTPGVMSYLGAVLVLLGCLLLAVGVEFAQIFFAPRTVSLNDLLAETIGSVIGVLLWVFGRGRLLEFGWAFARGGRGSVIAALIVFVAGYLLLSLFPYDFVVSGRELRERLESGASGWLLGHCGAGIRCLARSLAEIAAIAPIGLLLILVYPRLRLVSLFSLGIGIGVLLESLQLLLYSGSSQALSVPLRGLGILLGGLVGPRLMTRIGVQSLAQSLRRAVPILALPYLIALMAVSGWFTGAWTRPAQAFARTAELGWVPFYYHYWTSEPVAMASLLSQLAMYAPIGLAVWASAAAFPTRRSLAWLPGLLAFVMAMVVEAGKLFVTGARPDPTNLIIAPAGAWLAYWAAIWFSRALGEGLDPASVASTRELGTAPPRGMVPAQATDQRPAEAVGSLVSPDGRRITSLKGLWACTVSALFTSLPELPPVTTNPRNYLFATGFGALTLLGIALFPVGQVVLAIALLVYAAAVWRFPWVWLVVIPVVLPVCDLSPWTGRVLLNELDLVVLTTLAIGGLRVSGVKPAGWQSPLLPLAWLLLGLSWIVSTALGLGAALDAPVAVSSSHTPIEAWYVGKGMLWALLLVPLLRRTRRLLGSGEAVRRFIQGIVIGLAWTSLIVLLDRHVFVGLFDFENPYRVTG
ncbi:MAG: VanZ family protein, partial [Thiohalocapsa sp.]